MSFKPWSKTADWLFFAGWLIASTAWSVGAAAELGATFDEPVDVGRGLQFWRTGSHAPLLKAGAMPLPMDVAALPLYVYERWSETTLDLRQGDQRGAFFAARVALLPFWWLLLVYARLVGRSLVGPWGGRLAVAFLACDPNFLAHASLANKDMAATATFLPLLYFFARGRGEASWRRRIGLPALWFGLALFAKASALALAPVAWFFLETHRLVTSGAFRMPGSEGPHPTIGARVRHGIAQYRSWYSDAWRIGVWGLAVVFVLCGSDWEPQSSWMAWAHGLPAGTNKDVMVWLADSLKIFSNAGHGLVYQIRHNLRGHTMFLLGEMWERSVWYYYPVLFSMKLPLPILLVPGIVLMLHPRALSNWACAVALGCLLFSLQCKVQIGIRLMLPWLAVAEIGLAAALVRAAQSAASWRRPALVATAGGSVVWLALGAALIWPHGISFVNELWGGPTEGYRLVSDSNYDWGQGLPELARWQKRTKTDLAVWYFGTDPLIHEMPVERIRPADWSIAKAHKSLAGRHLAVGTTLLYGAYTAPDGEVLKLLRELKPVAHTETFLIFDFTNRVEMAATSSRISK